LHPETGSLREFFDGDWNPLASDEGRIVEPGHQFEWAWLLNGWASIIGDNRYIEKAKRLVTIGKSYRIRKPI
jgi:mannose-6-phosphate isomerase